MAMSLYRRLTRSQARHCRNPTSDEEDTSSSTLLSSSATVPEAPKKGLNALDNLDDTPPTPPTTDRCVSPSSRSNNGCKLRTPASTAPSLPPCKTTAFSEDFEFDFSPPLAEPAMAVTTAISSEPYSGKPQDKADQAAINGTSGRNEGTTVPAVADDTPVKRITRSQSRRMKRADSGASGLAQEGNGATNIPSVRKDSGDDVSAALTARKNSTFKIPRAPSPPKIQGGSGDQIAADHNKVTVPEPATKAANPPHCNADEQTLESFPLPDIRAKNPASLPAKPKTDTATSNQPTAFRFNTDSTAVALNRPSFAPTLDLGHEFCSDLASTSRPEGPWGWPRRWTCCQCGARTMVEQLACARLDCGHGRCGKGCAVKGGMLNARRTMYRDE